jgi:signal transduction histidine kinase
VALPDGGLGDERERDLETTVYRVVQEALNNVVKHARADSARVSIRAADEVLEIEVEDDGVGFDVDMATGGFGLAGMRERISLAGGTLEIRSGDGGTSLRARLLAAGVASYAAPPGVGVSRDG